MRRLIPFSLLALAAAPPAVRPQDAGRYQQCLALTRNNASAAVQMAAEWRVDGGGVPARHCLGVAMAAAGQPAAARGELEAAARTAEAAGHPLTAALWGQAGNAALLVGDPAGARADLSKALAIGKAAAPGERAGWLIDRARALVAASADEPLLVQSARADLDSALALTPDDPLARLLSGALARRMGDLARAKTDIDLAQKLSPSDPDVTAEAARIAAASAPPAHAAKR